MFLEGPNPARAQVYLFGAHIVSWEDNKEQQLFLSSKAKLDGSKAIRGGIPICFPQFGNQGPLKKNHGFARTSVWDVSDSKSSPQTQNDSSSVSVTFTLGSTHTSQQLWPNDFLMEYTVTLSPSVLRITWGVYNRNVSESFTFTGALHTYFAVPSIASAGVTGLQGLTYVDKAREGKEFKETKDVVCIPAFVDRVYASAPDSLTITDTGTARMRIEKQHLGDAVVWNPWIDNARKMSDMGDEEYLNMLCVEAGAITAPVTVHAGQKWQSSMTLSKL